MLCCAVRVLGAAGACWMLPATALAQALGIAECHILGSPLMYHCSLLQRVAGWPGHYCNITTLVDVELVCFLGQ